MLKCNKHHFTYILVLAYSIVSQTIFGITPLSFEDHFIFTQLLHLVALFALPLRFSIQTPQPSTLKVFAYAFGFLLAHTLSQTLLSFFLLPVCKWGYGLSWYLILELPSLFLLCSLYVFLRQVAKAWWSYCLMFLGFIFLFAVLIIFNLLYTPTLFFFHPTAGYYPGPLYDHWIPISPSLVLARVWTVLMGLVLLLVTAKKTLGYLLVLIFVPLLFQTELGFRSTHQSLQKYLPKHYQTKHSRVFALKQQLSQIELDSIDYYITQISQQLKLALPSKPISIYIYSDPELKKKLTGTHWTMIGNPKQQALHLLAFSPWDNLAIHELSHVVAAPLKKNLLSMPLNPLLTEGLAMYMQAEMAGLHVDQWAKAIFRFRPSTSIAMIDGFDTFYHLPPTHAYALAGSWTTFLIQTYGLDTYKTYYAGAPLQNTYGISMTKLEKKWRASLAKQPLSDTTYQSMLRSLQKKSVFQATCPHEVAHAEQKWQTCLDQTCQKHWQSYATSCNPQVPNFQRRSPIKTKTFKQLVAIDQMGLTQKQTWAHYIEVIKAAEKENLLAEARTTIEMALQVKTTRSLLRQYDRILFLSDEPAKANQGQTILPQP